MVSFRVMNLFHSVRSDETERGSQQRTEGCWTGSAGTVDPTSEMSMKRGFSMKRSGVVSIVLTTVMMLALGCAQEPAPPSDSTETRAEQANLLADLEAAAGGYERMLDEGAALAGSATAQALVLELGREPTEDEAAAVEAIMRSAIGEALTEDEWHKAVAGVYAEHLTAGEVAETRAFYASATGQKILGLGTIIDDEVVTALGAVLEAHEETLTEAIDSALADRFPELDEEGTDD